MAVSDQTLGGRALAHPAGERARHPQRPATLDPVVRALAALTPGGSIGEIAARFLHECRLMVGADHCGVLRFDAAAGEARILAYESDVVDRTTIPDVAPLRW